MSTDLKHLKQLRKFLLHWGNDSIYTHISGTGISNLKIRTIENESENSSSGARYDLIFAQHQAWFELVDNGILIDNGKVTDCELMGSYRNFKISPEYKEALLIYYI